MASLTGASIASSYTSLLKLSGNTDSLVAGNNSNAIQVVDGDGTTSPLYLNTDRVGIGGHPRNALHITSGTANCNFEVNASPTAGRVDLLSMNDANDAYEDINIYGDTIKFANASGLVELASGQLKFPATQNASADANTLDDYEESSWTPAWTQGFSSTNYNFQHGKYVKVGGLVSVFCSIGMTASGTTATSDPLRMELPFTAVSGMNNFVGTAVVQSGAALDTESAYIRCGTAGGADATAFFVGQADAADGQQAINGDDIGTSGTINFQITYQTT